MTTIDPDEAPLDPDTGLPQEPADDAADQGAQEALDDEPKVDEPRADMLGELDLPLDEPPRRTDDLP